MDESFPMQEQEPAKGYASAVEAAEQVWTLDVLTSGLNEPLRTPVDLNERDAVPLAVVDEQGQSAGTAVCAIHIGDARRVSTDFNTAGAIEEAMESYVVVRKPSGELWLEPLRPGAVAASEVTLSDDGRALPLGQEVNFESETAEWHLENGSAVLFTKAYQTRPGYFWMMRVLGPKKGSVPHPGDIRL